VGVVLRGDRMRGLVSLFVWEAVPYPWVGTIERVLALALVAWVAALGSRLASERPFPGLVARGQVDSSVV
jgi:hypothetical protein